jgi:isopenicillin N synthase-like dioxygenase
MSSDDASSVESNTLDLPVIDFAAYFRREEDPAAYETECRRAAEAFKEHGALAVRDPRVFPEDNERFLDMMERYFGLSDGARGIHIIPLLFALVDSTTQST